MTDKKEEKEEKAEKEEPVLHTIRQMFPNMLKNQGH